MQVLILGSFELVDDNGVSITLNGPKIRALTALLALEAGRVVSTDKLIDGIYGEDQPLRAGNALQLQVSKLRSTLRSAGGGAEQSVVTRPPGYVLDIPGDDVDALHFAHLVADGRRAMATDPARASALFHQALGLWRGPALADFSFDDFATGDRVRLEALRLAALEDCIESDLDLGRHAECIDQLDQLEQLVAAHPLRERPWGQLMVALYRAGRQAESLRAFARARHHLGEELGIDPGPELRRLEAAILVQDPSLAGPAPGSGSWPRPAARRRRDASRGRHVGEVGGDLGCADGRAGSGDTPLDRRRAAHCGRGPHADQHLVDAEPREGAAALGVGDGAVDRPRATGRGGGGRSGRPELPGRWSPRGSRAPRWSRCRRRPGRG